MAFLDKAGVVVETRREHGKKKREVEGKTNTDRVRRSGKVGRWWAGSSWDKQKANPRFSKQRYPKDQKRKTYIHHNFDLNQPET